jgi:hypothetical protein
MQLIIKKNSLAEDVKKVFTSYYPFLKIEFYKRSLTNSLYKKEPLALNLPLIRQIIKQAETVINIEENKTVFELENDFLSIGLYAEIFRKSGNVWVETSLTNNWTLQHQNAEAEELSRHFFNS